MTVSTELSHEEYTGNGVTTDFDFRFRIFEAKHLVVSIADQDGTERILMNGTDYTLRGVGSYRGGKVILKMPLATGWKIGIARDLPAVQETDLRNQGKFFAEVHEDAFDYLTMLIQKSLGFLSLCLRKPSFISDHYDAKGNKISNLGKPVKDGDAVDLGTMKEHISAKDKRSLRVADKDIPALPGTSVRRNKQLGFDNNGMPLLLDPAETGALGYVLVDSFEKGAVITSRYKALHWLHNGEYYRWDGNLPKTVSAGSTPDSAGGVGVGAWLGVGDLALRSDLAGNDGGRHVGFGQEHTIDDLKDVVKSELNSHYLPTPFYLSNKEISGDTLKVATFNIWTGGSVPEYYGNDYASKFRLMDLYYELIKSGCDFCGMQECYIFPQNPASDFIIKPFKDSFFGCADYIGREWFSGNLSVSRQEFISEGSFVFNDINPEQDKGGRGYTRCVIEKNGKVISIYNTHLSWEWSAAEKMRDQLLQAVAADENNMIIITGDFNRDDADFFAPFINAGFSRGNNGRYNTKNRDGEWFIDEVLHKGFSVQKSSGVQDVPYGLADHKLFYVELSL